jgi:F-type H+-transporting ATPase subunit b
MQETLQALSGILLKAVPTVILLIILHFYLKAVLFGPLDRVMKERRKLTEGARELADASLAAATRKADEYEAKLREARAAVYKQQEEIRKQWLEEQAQQVAEARTRSEAAVKASREAIAEDAAAARKSLQDTSAAVADQIVAMVLGKRAAA